MDKIAIVGLAQTPFSAPKTELTYADLVYDVTTRALADAGLEIKDIDNIVTVSNDFWDGRTISSMAVGDAAGAAYGGGKNVSTVEGDGTFGAFYGMTRILSGSYQTTLVVAHSKGSESDNRLITNAFFDPVLERPLGLDSVAAAALQARAYMERRGVSAERCAAVAAKNRANAVKNPNAHLRKAVSVEEVLESRLVSDPLRIHDCCPISDGAAAIILASEGFAKKRAKKPVWVEGVSFCAEASRLGERDLRESPALRAAAKKAYAQAGLRDPKAEIDVAEVSELFSYQELLWSEEMGLCGSEEQAGLPVNPSGGCLSAHAVIAAGLVRIIEAALQLRGEASNQVPGARRALAHGQNGLCGQSHCVWVLGG